jgi:putative transposase
VARPLRIAIPGGVYHLIARGNARGRLFLDDDDRVRFLLTLSRVVDRFGWACHAYCLMDNHYHLVVETPRPDLSAGMRQLNGVYAQRFNERRDRCGHVFEGRFRSILVEKETHLLAVCRYVVLNPVRAGMCADAGSYRWSSYRATAGAACPPTFLTTTWILSNFADSRAAAQARYREFVAASEIDMTFDRVHGERFGSEPFMRDRFGHDPPLPEIPRVQIEPRPRTLEEIFARPSRRPVATAYRRHGYSLRQIAEYLECHYSTVSRRLRREEAEADA